jgi:hypothetical protein
MVKESTKGSGENWLREGKREMWGGGYNLLRLKNVVQN